MDLFSHREGAGLHAEEVPVADLAERHGTPLYVYSAGTLRHHARVLKDAFASHPTRFFYSVKANGNLSVLRVLRDEGFGFDVVSGGELERALAAGADPMDVVFAGVGKTDAELRRGLEVGIRAFNVEAEEELEALDRIAGELGTTAPVALRLNPDVDPDTHRYITTGRRENKFGVDLETARAMVRGLDRLSNVRLAGLHAHVGSQLTSPQPHARALATVLEFADWCAEQGRPPGHLNLGGGFGIHYRGDEAPPATAYAEALLPLTAGRDLELHFEPGRFVAGNAGVLVVRVVRVKRSGDRRFVICDAGMNALLRPCLYDSHHRIWPVAADGPPPPAPEGDEPAGDADVVGPICESADFLGLGRDLPEVSAGDLLAVHSAGAYGFAMANRYNTHPLPAEVLVDGADARLVRRRETVEDILAPERLDGSPDDPPAGA